MTLLNRIVARNRSVGQVTPPPAGRRTKARPTVGYAYLGEGVGITLTHRNHRIFVYTRDRGLSPHLILFGEWERAIEEAVLRHVRPGGKVIEVGCNVGYHTLAMADRLGPEGHLYGFEANPEIYDLLRWTMDINGFLSRSTLYNHAVTEVPGDVSFRYERQAVGGGHVVTGEAASGGTVITVPGQPLDQTLSDIGSVDLIRMDAEGFEPFIVRGAQKIIERSPKIVIICEWSPGMMASRLDIPAYVREMAAKGFKSWRILSDSSLAPVPAQELPALDHCEVLFTRGNPIIKPAHSL